MERARERYFSIPAAEFGVRDPSRIAQNEHSRICFDWHSNALTFQLLPGLTATAHDLTGASVVLTLGLRPGTTHAAPQRSVADKAGLSVVSVRRNLSM